MKRAFVILVCLFAMLSTGTGLKAQEVTITLKPGWTWIGFPFVEAKSISEALPGFVPMDGDEIVSKTQASMYDEEDEEWSGPLQTLVPGLGYMYHSTRTEAVQVVLNASSSSNVTVTTSEPTDINYYSAMCGGTVTVADGDHVFMRGVCWGTEPNPTVDDNRTTDEAGIGSWVVRVYGLTMGTTYHVRAYAVTDNGLKYGEDFSFTTEIITAGEHDYVDLGLPSGIMWATCNVGASTPEEYGDYFAWGETQTKDVYSWSTYQYCNGSSNTLTRYCSNSDYGYEGFTDSLTVLLPEDDAATANWGADWRMPTIEEWEELYQNTTMTWTTQNDVNGMLFTASNGNSLFLPAAGDRYYSSLNLDGIYGLYQSSSLYTDYPNNAWRFLFDSDELGRLSNLGRTYGQSVRAVCSGQNVQSYTINVSVNPSDGGIVSGDGAYEQDQTCTVTATANSGYVFTNWTENGEVVSTDASYTFTVQSDRTLVANFSHAYVDLGLPSGTLWATCNVGADSPEEYGDYFAWGETQSKNTYNWSTYQYCNGSSSTLTKYCNNSSYGYNGFTDNLTTLLSEDDAASANWGNEWRMPTKEEWLELYNNTTMTWTTQNGVNGRLFTASNGNSLFLPAAGYRNYGSLNDAGCNGYYWSSSLGPDYPYDAWDFSFISGSYGMDYYYRYYGQSVRAVCSGQN